MDSEQIYLQGRFQQRYHMGVVNISYLFMDDIALYEEMVSHTGYVLMTVMEPVLERADFEFVYIF